MTFIYAGFLTSKKTQYISTLCVITILLLVDELFNTGIKTVDGHRNFLQGNKQTRGMKSQSTGTVTRPVHTPPTRLSGDSSC